MRDWETVSAPGNPFKITTRVAANGDIETEYNQTNMSEILQVNTALQNEEKRSSALWNGRDHVHVARIPEEIIHGWAREGINFYRWNEQDRARVRSKVIK